MTSKVICLRPPPPEHRLVCRQDTSSKEDGSFRSFQSASMSILGPYSSKTDCAVFIEIPWPKSCQHHRVLATTKSTDCLAAWHEKSCRKKSLPTHGAARCRMSKRMSLHTYAIFCQTLQYQNQCCSNKRYKRAKQDTSITKR